VFAMVETARGLTALEQICAVPGLTGVYVGPADLAISMGYGVTDAWSHPAVHDAMTRIQATASAAGLVTGIHAGAGKLGKAMAQSGFRLITLASESQALRRGAVEHLAEATAQSDRESADRTAMRGYP
jgi:4-hydroxy-2-oxoheptanedioate aldolase